jgi:transcriptional regulator with XRE-family HTH domain
MGPNESAPRLPAAGPLKGQDAGAIVRAARLAAGLTLAELGRRCGYSASQVSRYERGVQPLTDITLLRRFSQVLAIPPQAFGLTPPGGAAATAARLGSDANHRFTAFGPSGVILYQVSIAQVLGDSGTSIQYARKLHPAVLTTAERQGRYWVDVARAYHQWGKPEPCYRALLSAERAAPAEVSYRPPVHRMTKDLLRADRSLPGLRAFAHRIGVPDA